MTGTPVVAVGLYVWRRVHPAITASALLAGLVTDATPTVSHNLDLHLNLPTWAWVPQYHSSSVNFGSHH